MDYTSKSSRQQRRAKARAASRDNLGGFLFVPPLTGAEPSLDAVTQGDAAFFDQNPGRSHRVRLAELVEIHQVLAAGGPAVVPKHDGMWNTLVHQVRRGTRLRQVLILPEDTKADAGEDYARALWQRAAPLGSETDQLVRAAREFGL